MTRLLLMVMTCAWLCACTSSRGEFLESRSFAMGTWVDIVAESTGDGGRDTGIFREIESLLRSYEVDYYAWAPDGELANINRHISESRAVEVSEGMRQLLSRAQQFAAASDGSFDPGVGGLVELWGFHDSVAPAADPGEAPIRRWLDAAPSIMQLRIDAQRVSSSNDQLQLDLGGIAKGEAVDRIVALLRRHGVNNALVNAGGDLRALGKRADRSWRVGIKAPRTEGLLGYIDLEDGEAAFTSGDYERFFDEDGTRMHHLLDARTGYPAAHTQAVTVLATDGLTADAAATAIFVAGPARWRAVAEKLNIGTVLRVDASGKIEMTEMMRTRLVPATENGDPVIVEG